MIINLPQLSWFRQIQDNRPVRNIFTGSLGTNSEHGSLRCTTFNYKVYAEDTAKEGEEENIVLIAQCHIQLPWAQNLECKNHQQKEFEFSPQGITQAATWLEEQFKQENIG